MRPELLFAIGTLAVWLGWAMVARAAYCATRLLWREPGLDAGALGASCLTSLGVAAGALLFGWSVLPSERPGPDSGWLLPLVWVTMPFTGWVGIAFAAMSVARLVHALLAADPKECNRHWRSAGWWGLGATVCVMAFLRFGGEIEVLRGSLPMPPKAVLALVALTLASLGAMVYVSRESRRRGIAKAVATHLALMAGSVVFGLPFVWLLITSFKEDRDMASEHGIIWIPKVQQTVPYYDPDDPLIETTFQDTTVQGTILERLPDGSLSLEILRPAALRSMTCVAKPGEYREVPRRIPLVMATISGRRVLGKVVKERDDGRREIEIVEPRLLAGGRFTAFAHEVEPYRKVGLRWQNYPDALEFLPPETNRGLVYLQNTLILVVLNVLGTILSSSIVAYAFARMRFPGRNALFLLVLSTMMLPAAVTLLPQFLIFRWLGWIDTLAPLWVPAFLGSAFNIFLLRQFFLTIPMELEDAARMDGCTYLRTFWQVMLPQVKPALAVVAIWTFVAAWNNFMGPLVYINSPENMPIAYAVQLFQGERSGEPGLLMAFATMAMLPVLLVFFFAQKYFIEGVTLSGLGGR